MVRFDMDALPITEEYEGAYASMSPGLMHACGHDAHMAIGLGVATLVARHRGEMAGSLKLIFQPAEEEGTGAEAMVKAGALDDPCPNVFLSDHVWNYDSVGTVGVAPGEVMAASDKWVCTVHGKGGHAAMPHQTVDPIVTAAQIVTAMQTVTSRSVDPLFPAVLTVGTFHSGDAFNAIPGQVDMSGTTRTFSPQVRDTVLRRMREIVAGVATACGGTAELEISAHSPAVINDPNVAGVVRKAAEAAVGAENVHDSERTMGSEDAAWFMQDVPGCYFFLGSANAARGLDAPHHNSRFDIDEGVLPLGVSVLMNAIAHYV
jgi:amidohydrolase